MERPEVSLIDEAAKWPTTDLIVLLLECKRFVIVCEPIGRTPQPTGIHAEGLRRPLSSRAPIVSTKVCLQNLLNDSLLLLPDRSPRGAVNDPSLPVRLSGRELEHRNSAFGGRLTAQSPRQPAIPAPEQYPKHSASPARVGKRVSGSTCFHGGSGCATAIATSYVAASVEGEVIITRSARSLLKRVVPSQQVPFR